jgi:hypothetical protein
MAALFGTILAGFTTPMRIDTNPASVLWLLPLVVVISVVYKATKVHRVRPVAFAKESAVLCGSILVFILVATLILFCLAWIAAGHLSSLFDGSAF